MMMIEINGDISDEQIDAWVDGVILDVANVGEMDDCWHLRQMLAAHVLASRQDPAR